MKRFKKQISIVLAIILLFLTVIWGIKVKTYINQKEKYNKEFHGFSSPDDFLYMPEEREQRTTGSNLITSAPFYYLRGKYLNSEWRPIEITEDVNNKETVWVLSKDLAYNYMHESDNDIKLQFKNTDLYSQVDIIDKKLKELNKSHNP